MPIFEAKQHTESKRESIFRGRSVGREIKANTSTSTIVNTRVKANEEIFVSLNGVDYKSEK